jgi:DNA primase
MVKLGVWHVGLMFDNDEAGQLATEDAERKLIGTGILHRRIDYEGKDPGELSSKEIKRFYKWTV